MTPAELVDLIREAAPDGPEPFALGTVDEGYAGGLPRVRFDNETTASVRTRPHLAGYVPAAGDRVLLGRVGSGWVVLGRVVS